MATKSSKKGSRSKKAAKPGGDNSRGRPRAADNNEATLTVTPDYTPQFPYFYSNYASVSHTSTEFFLDFCLLGLPYRVDLENKTAAVPVVARIVIPPRMMESLITAMQSQVDKQKEAVARGSISIGPVDAGGKKQ